MISKPSTLNIPETESSLDTDADDTDVTLEGNIQLGVTNPQVPVEQENSSISKRTIERYIFPERSPNEMLPNGKSVKDNGKFNEKRCETLNTN